MEWCLRIEPGSINVSDDREDVLFVGRKDSDMCQALVSHFVELTEELAILASEKTCSVSGPYILGHQIGHHPSPLYITHGEAGGITVNAWHIFTQK